MPKDLLQAGADYLAHSVRDAEVDEELIGLDEGTQCVPLPYADA